MGCYHPILAYRSAKTDEVRIVGPVKTNDDKDQQALYLDLKGWRPGDEKLLLPCGKCVGCQLAHSRDWANRCYLEQKMHTWNWWITLTYDPEHIKTVKAVDKKTGEVVDVATLCRKHVTDFIKRLRMHWKRKYGEDGIVYFGCGEYGSKSLRPHYHISFFNLNIRDLELWYWEDGKSTYRSDTIDELWGMGRVTINENTWATAAYTARYMLKKSKNWDARRQYEEVDMEKEFTCCSLKPAIGKSYYDAHKDEIYATDQIILLKQIGKAIHQKPPKYFDKLMSREDPERLKECQRKRKELAEKAAKLKIINTTLNRIEYAKVQERILEDRSKQQQRKYEQMLQ